MRAHPQDASLKHFVPHAVPAHALSSSVEVRPAAVRVPRSIEEVDNGKVLGFGPDLSEDHPGFGDSDYKRRRVDICTLARSHQV